MEEFVQGLMTKVGLDKETADKVMAYIKENAEQIPKLLTSNETAKGLMDKLPGGLGGMLGGLGGGEKKED